MGCHSWSSTQQYHNLQLGQATSQLCQRTGIDDVGHRLWLSAGALVRVDLSPSLPAGTAMTLRSLEAIQERPLSLTEVKAWLSDLWGRPLRESWPPRLYSSLSSTDLWCLTRNTEGIKREQKEILTITVSSGEKPGHTLLSALAPVRMMWEFSTCTMRWPRRTMYAPMPTARHETRLIVTMSLYAHDVSPAIMPDPLRHSTPMPSSSPITQTSLVRETRYINVHPKADG